MAEEKRWLTKDQKRLLKPHAQHYVAMYSHILDASTEDLQRLYGACVACTEVNCGWDDYAAAQYLKVEITREIGCRNRRDAEAAEKIEPATQSHDRWTDDGGAASRASHYS